VRALSEGMCLENALYRHSSLELKNMGVQLEPEDDLGKSGGTAQTERMNRF
jgi:hypothetical protein